MVVLHLRQIFILTFFNNFLVHTWSFLNIEEIQSTKYGLEITGVPVLLTEDPDVTNSLMLSSKHGQRYHCILPEVEAKQTEKETKRTFSTKEVTDLLQPMQNRCIRHNKGWWTYEFCYGKSVSQYHEEGNSVAGNKISLGIYSSQTDWDKQEIEVPYSKNSSKRFHSQFFENGTTCDLNGAQRTTEVKFKCEVNTKDHIAMVNEPSSCTYVVEVHTAKLCAHPLFKPPASQKPLAITCSPALQKEHYEKYLEAVELEKKAQAKAIADKIRKMKEADDHYDDEDLDDVTKPKKKKSAKSQVWPWDQVAESEDRTLISGDISKGSMKVDRMDIIKDRKVDEEGQVDQNNGIISITSRYVTKDRKPKQTVVDIIEDKEESKADQAKDSTDDNQQQTTEETEKLESQNKDSPSTDKPSEDIASSHKKTGEENEHDKPTAEKAKDRTTKKAKKSLEEEWQDALAQARNQLKSVVRKQLKGMGIDPNELENRVKAMIGGKASKTQDTTPEQDKQDTNVEAKTDGLKEAVDHKINNMMKLVEQMEKDGKLGKNSNEKRLMSNIHKIMQGMDHQNIVLMKKEETIQRELEKHFDELRDRYNDEVDMMKRFIEEIEDRDSNSGYKDDNFLKNIVEKLKTSLHRFDKSNRALSEDMEAVKELNKEVHSKIDDVVSSDKTDKKTSSGEFFRLAGKANLVLRRLLQRSAQLDKDLQNMKEISRQAKARNEEYADILDEDPNMNENKRVKREAEKRLGFVVDKLKKMLTDIDNDDDTITKESEEPLPDFEPISDNFKVRVSKIKGDDGKTVWTDGNEDEPTEGTGGELEIEDKLKKASKRMERLVKKQLESAGINPGGKIRVKIVTSREALENVGGKKGMDVLSDEETDQFKKMIFSLMGGSSEAGEEKKRQNKLENNYNLVWGDNSMKKASDSDEEDPDTELVFDDTDLF